MEIIPPSLKIVLYPKGMYQEKQLNCLLIFSVNIDIKGAILPEPNEIMNCKLQERSNIPTQHSKKRLRDCPHPYALI